MKMKDAICGLRRFTIFNGLLLMTVFSARADYKSTVLSDQPVAYFALDLTIDNSGTATDLSGNGNNSAYYNLSSTAGPSAFIPNAAFFPAGGVQSFVDLSSGTNTGILNFGGPITMEAWVQSTNTTQGPADIIGKGYDSSQSYNELVLRANAGNYYGGTYNNTNGSGNASGGQQTTNWAYLVSTYDGTNWNLYVNGVRVGQSANSLGAINFSDPWAIGTGSADGFSRFFQGTICQVALYSYALSSYQVLSHYFVGEIGVTASNAVALITAQPQPQPSYAGGSVTFTVSYLTVYSTTNQWYKNGNPISGQTNKSLTLNNVQSGDVANYSVRIGNLNGSTNSASVALTLLASGRSLRWSATSNSGVWDAGTSTNWINVSNSLPVVFNSGDQVLFDDTVGVPTAVSVSGAVSPFATTVNSSANNFTVSGSGTITGAGSLVKQGSSTLEIMTTNDFTGSVTISGGTVKMDEPLSGAATSLGAGSGAPIVVTNGATLAVNASGGYPAGNSGISTRAITISGSGVGGIGALRSVGNDIYHDGSPQGGLFRSLTLAGDATIGSSGRWDLGQEGILTFINTGGKNYNLSCLQGGYSEWHEVTIDTNLGNIDYTLASGSYWVLDGMGNSLGNPTNTITLHGNVQMQIQHDGNGGDNGYAKIVHVTTGSQFGYRPGGGTGDYHLATTLQLDDSVTWYFFNGNGGSETGVTVGGRITFNGVTHLSIGDSAITFTNIISGPGGLVWDSYNHPVVFTAANTYNGPTVIGGGLTLVLRGNGSIGQSSLIFFGGSNPTNVSLDVSGRPDKTLTLASGQTLGGIGAISGSLVVAPGATVSPSGTNTTIGFTLGANTTGTISATNAVALNGTTILKLNGSGVNDQIQAGAGITYGGTLNLVNISGAPYTIGNSFQIFSAATYTGSFTGITPATPGPGMAWDTSQLNIGFLNVIAAPPQPVIGSATVSGGNLIFSGTGGTASGSYLVLTTTNLTTPQTNWAALATNSFDSSGNFSVTNAVSGSTPRRFYRLKTLP